MEIRAEIATREIATRRIGERIRDARQAKGWTQAELAYRARVREALISKYECGRHIPSIEQLRRLARALGVTADYLLGDEGGTR